MASAAAVTEAPSRRGGRLREPATRGAHLLVLSGFALAQPLFDILAKHAEFFAVRGSRPVDIVLFALAVTFVPALVLLIVELAVGALHRGAGLALHLVLCGGLFAAFAIQVLERAGISGTLPLIAGAVVAGVAAGLALWRTRVARSFLTILSPAPLVFLASFLFFSPVSDLVFPDDVEVATAQVRADAPVVLLILDELPTVSLLDREGEIDAVRYPNFARLAGDSTWFRNATTLSAQTSLAVPAILTGRLPRPGRLPVFQDHPQNLFTLLGGAYRLNAHESQTHLCPPELCTGEAPAARERLRSLYADARVVYGHLVAPPALAERLPAIDEAWTDFGTEADVAGIDPAAPAPEAGKGAFYVGRIAELNTFLRSLRPAPEGGAPSLNVHHLLLPHGPWLHLPSGRTTAVQEPRAPGRTGERWWNGHLAEQAYARHLLQLGYTDRMLGRLIRRLEETGLYERSLVVVVADHGISFRGGDDRRTPTERNLQDLAFVPFFVKRPGETDAGEVVDRHVRIVDVLPTIAEALGVDVPWRVDGRSVFAEGPEPEEVRVRRATAAFAALLERRDEALRRQVSLFGDRGWNLFGAGPHGDLLEAPVEPTEGGQLGLGPPVEAGAVIDRVPSRQLRSFQPRARLVPTPITGRVTGELDAGAALAVALNGRVEGFGELYENTDGSLRFSALVAEDAFRPGENDVRVFAIEGPSSAPFLRELETSLS